MSSETDFIPFASSAAHVLTGHASPVTRIAFHPQRSILASASEDTTVMIWDWKTEVIERTLNAHTQAVTDVDFSHNGLLLVSCSTDLTVKIWDIENGWNNTKTLVGHEHSVSCARFLPGDQLIASACRDRKIRLFDVTSGDLVRTILGHSEWVRYVVPSDDGALLASCSNDRTARIWNPLTGEEAKVLSGHTDVLEAVEFAPIVAYPAIRELAGLSDADSTTQPGAFVVTASRDLTIKLWNAQSGQLLKTFVGHKNWIRALVFHPSGEYLLSGSDDKTIRVWKLSTGECVRTIVAHDHFVTSLALGPQVITAGSVNAAEPEKAVYAVASGSVDQGIKIWFT